MLNVSQILKVIHHVEKYLHNSIIYIKGEAWIHTTSFHHPISLKYMYQAGNVSDRVMFDDFVSILTIFQLGFGTVPSMWYLFSCYVEMTYVNICRNL